MIEVQSPLENQEFKLIDLEKKLKPIGYAIGGGWDYDHGYFDYVMNDESSYLCVRLPFYAAKGELDTRGVIVRLGRPFLLAHTYESGQDDDNTYDPNPWVNQFAEPEDKDDNFPGEWINTGKEYIKELEQVILHDMKIYPRGD
ncbi:YugN family protein [Alteribacter populi]|uniref:YugN family protein n=1 Tax=Alteribacter populi TaxID=2011011 RepID=UPI000BBAE2E4|nr:YugN family protein [Alteribacter populi]